MSLGSLSETGKARMVTVNKEDDKMPKFKIYVETRQTWACEAELQDAEAAKELQMGLYDVIQRHIQNNEDTLKDAISMSDVLVFDDEAPSPNTFEQEDYWGADDFSDDDIVNLEVQELQEGRAELVRSETMTLVCPHCDDENTYDDESEEFAEIYKTIEDERKAFVVHCDACGGDFKVDYCKKY